MERDFEIDDNMKEIHLTRRHSCPGNKIVRYSGFVSAFLAACLYAGMAILVSSLADEMKSLTLTFVRAFLSSSVSFIVMCHQGGEIRIKSISELKFHLVTSVFVSAAMVCQFYAYHHMPTADASAILYGYVVFTGVYARILLKESLGVFGVVMVILTFGGILLIARPPFLFQIFETGTFETNSGMIFPAIVAVAGTQAISLNIVTLRAMGKQNIPVMKTMFYTMTITMLILAVPISFLGQWSIPNCTWGRIRMVLAATCGFLGYTCLSYALSVENAIYVSLVCLNDFIIVFVVSMIFLGFKPPLFSVVGMFLVTGSAIAILLRKVIMTRKGVAESQPSQKLPVTVPLKEDCQSLHEEYAPPKITSV